MIKQLLFGLGLAALTGAAQTVDLKGRVLDKADDRPIAGAAVRVAGTEMAGTTDSAGRFRLAGVVSVLPGGRPRKSAPYFKAGALHVQAAAAGQEARIEYFTLGGESLYSATAALAQGWNRVAAPEPGRDFLGFARITVDGESWVLRILQMAGRLLAAGEGPAKQGRLAKKAPGNLAISMARLKTRIVPFAGDTADLGDIYLDYPARKLDVGAPPIYGAVVLFDGTRGMAEADAELRAKWQDWPRFTPSEIKFRLAKDPEFPADADRVTLQTCCNTLWGYDDIQAKEVHGDAQLHVEWIGMGRYDSTENPDIGPQGVKDPGYINSGVYIQSRYEIQIESPGVSDARHTMASLVDDYAADSQAPNRGNGKWQAYDVTFRSARYDAQGKRTENARITVWWNGVLVHDNRDAKAPATGIDPAKHSGEELTPILYGLKLQSEGRDVRYRNVWMKHLDIEKPQTNFGY